MPNTLSRWPPPSIFHAAHGECKSVRIENSLNFGFGEHLERVRSTNENLPDLDETGYHLKPLT